MRSNLNRNSPPKNPIPYIVSIVFVALVGLTLALVPSSATAQTPPPLPPPVLSPGPIPAITRHQPLATQAAKRVSLGQDPYTAVDQCVAEEMSQKNIPGGAVAIVVDGRVVYNKGLGVKKRGETDAVNPGTQFRIGSVTKMMTAAAVMQQVEAGRVDLRAPVTRYIPEFKLADGRHDQIQVFHTLTHTTGYPDNAFSGSDNPLVGPTTPEALGEWAAATGDVRLHAPPGSFWNYSNPNFMLAGLVAERASGIPYHRLMAEQVWARAAMSDTTLLPAVVMTRGDYTWGYWTNPFTGQPMASPPDDYDHWAVAPAGYAFSTVGDLAKWAILMMNGGEGVLSPASVQAMQTGQVGMDYTPDDLYGFGVFLSKYKGLTIRSHGGNIPGWGAILLWIPELRFAVATLNNTFPDNLSETPYCAIEALLKPASVPTPDYSTAPYTWARYAGLYPALDSTGGALPLVVSKPSLHLATDFRITFTSIPDPFTPGEPYSSRLWPAVLNTFLLDSDANGQPDLDVTFIEDRHAPGEVQYLRGRSFVGVRERGRLFFPYMPASLLRR